MVPPGTMDKVQGPEGRQRPYAVAEKPRRSCQSAQSEKPMRWTPAQRAGQIDPDADVAAAAQLLMVLDQGLHG